MKVKQFNALKECFAKSQDNMNMEMNQNCVFELLKQFISLNKIMAKNKAAEEKGEHIGADEKRLLPFFLVKFAPHSEININKTEDMNLLVLQCNQEFDVMNENHLF